MAKSSWKTHSADLLQMYMNLGLIGPSEISLEGWNRNYFTMYSGTVPSSGSVVYHCIFTCPIRGIHFPCDRLKNSPVSEIDDMFWYKTGKRAHQAAAAKAINDLKTQESIRKRNQNDKYACHRATFFQQHFSMMSTSPPSPPSSIASATTTKATSHSSSSLLYLEVFQGGSGWQRTDSMLTGDCYDGASVVNDNVPLSIRVEKPN
mmetsp:Transcript_18368/g.32856  ORF Transcript_18368/g.32856 Transcript_18368/m.32856 type:complete len:205 (+) Transcript_18368:71-685(+)